MASSFTTGKSDGTRAARRVWSLEEEAALCAGLRDLVVRGWKKPDNGFRPGYAMFLQQHLNNIFPGTDLKAEPHITSKIHVWKKYYYSLALMQAQTGFGWNDTTNMVTVEDDSIWQAHIKVDPAAKPLRHKSWPLFKEWVEIFGKDRATGENATGFADYAGRTTGERSAPFSCSTPPPTGERSPCSSIEGCLLNIPTKEAT